MSGSVPRETSSSAVGGSQRHWFEAVADHLGAAYLRYSFTKGTDQEVAFLVDALGLEDGSRVLDVGCGPGRHAHALTARGCRVVGVDISERFVQLASETGPPGGDFVRADARRLPVQPRFDAVISLCQGGFGLPADPSAPDDGRVLHEMARALVPGGRLAVSAFSSYFMVRHLEDSDDFDAGTGVNRERTVVKDEAGAEDAFDLWTACYTPRELRLLAQQSGLRVLALWSVTPGGYEKRAPDVDHPEFLLLADRVAF